MVDRLKVLLVESDQKSAAELGDALKKRGMEILLSRDAIHALNVARQVKPDAVVVNSQLAGGGGLVVLKRIRSNVHTAHLPIIAIIKSAGAQDGKLLLEAGAQQCVTQPVDADALIAVVQNNLLPSLDFTQAPAEVLTAPKRIASLKETRLLDTAPEESFDQLASIATRLLGTPTALMTLVDRDRQFFKSQVGLPQPWAAARQTRLSHSFCQWVVSGNEELVIEDAREHPVLKSNLAIKDIGVIAYAGVPLNANTGQSIGSFCAIDSRPRTWSEVDLATLRDLGQVTEACALLRRTEKESASTGATSPAEQGALMQACATAIMGLTRVLNRHQAQLEKAGRSELVNLIQSHGRQLMGFAA